jgi:hypothetical protein
VFGAVRRQGPPLARGLELPVEERESVDAGIRHVEFLDAEIAAVERLIARQDAGLARDRSADDRPGSEPRLSDLLCVRSGLWWC